MEKTTCAEPVRTIHHFACSGGTLISKAVAALPRTVLLSEIDPLSDILLPIAGDFTPTDMLRHLRRSRFPHAQEVIVETFVASVAALQGSLARRGHSLVLRDHPHSLFCLDRIDSESRPSLLEILQPHLSLRSVVTVRHPLDAFLSLNAQGWRHFTPFTLDEYSRRYLQFLDRHAGIPIVRYEDFVAAPEATLEQICQHLNLTFDPSALTRISEIHLSGDSGRKGDEIVARPRRDIPEDIAEQRGKISAYTDLCDRFHYQY